MVNSLKNRRYRLPFPAGQKDSSVPLGPQIGELIALENNGSEIFFLEHEFSK